MVAWKRAAATGGILLLLAAANKAPYDADFGAWLTTEPPAAVEVPAAPEIVEDIAVSNAAALEAPAVETWAPAAPTLRSLVAEVRHHAEAAPMDAEMECLARSVYWEAKGEPLEGQLAVAEVILNRVERGRFGADVCAVVKAPRQFSFVKGGTIPAPVNARAWSEARAIAWIALAEAWQPIVGEATHFHARYVNPGWRMQKVAAVGNHIFYR
jgi:spore germination cell wall hydrolase CwlJ-like protein